MDVFAYMMCGWMEVKAQPCWVDSLPLSHEFLGLCGQLRYQRSHLPAQLFTV